MKRLEITDYSHPKLPAELPRPLEGDPNIDVNNWEVKPSQELVDLIGDISRPSKMTVFKEVLIAAEIIHLHSKLASETDIRYAKNALWFVAQNRREMDLTSPEEGAFLETLYEAIGVAEYQAHVNLK